MKRIKMILAFSLVTLFISGCALTFPKITSHYISPIGLEETESKPYILSLSPDGEMIAVGYGPNPSIINLNNGKNISIREKFDYNELLENRDGFDFGSTWSFDGRYLGISAKHYEPNSVGPVGDVFYVFDMKTENVSRYEVPANMFSPFNPNRVYHTWDSKIHNLEDGTAFPLPTEYDFSDDEEFRVSGWYLWSKRLDAPVAQLSSLPQANYDNPVPNQSEVVIESYSYPMDYKNPKYSISTGFISKRPNGIVKTLFDPTGEYILIAEWQCSADYPKPCVPNYRSEDVDVYMGSVYDTVLTLVRWRTGEQKELIKLSEIDPENVIAYGYMAWSSDGSTIYISRYNAPPVVLKVEYP